MENEQFPYSEKPIAPPDPPEQFPEPDSADVTSEPAGFPPATPFLEPESETPATHETLDQFYLTEDELAEIADLINASIQENETAEE